MGFQEYSRRSLTIYVSAAIAAGRANPEDVNEIIRAVRRAGHAVAMEKVGLPHKGAEAAYAQFVFTHDRKKLQDADAMLAEVSSPSIGVGWEISFMSEVEKKPVFCLYRMEVADRVSYMVLGNENPLVGHAAYDPGDIGEAVGKAIAFFETKVA